jgi:tetratricopeptide (TPR) repeat protein
MKLKKHIILLGLLSVIQLPVNNLFSQDVAAKPTRQSSFEAFSQGNYEKAYNQFKELLVTYTKDPLYKYYSGVCLVKLSKQPAEATNLLQDALQAGSNIKTLPSDGLFYLGRAQQMSGRFPEATEAYNAYVKQVGKRAARDMDVPEYLKQCEQQKGKLAETELAIIAETVPEIKKEPEQVSKAEVLPEAVQPVKTVEKTVNTGENLPLSYEKILSQAVEFQYKADSVSVIVSKEKKDLELLAGAERLSLKLKINDNEKVAASFQAQADQKYKEAQATMGTQVNTNIHPKENALPVLQDTVTAKNTTTVRQALKQTDTSKTPVRSTKPQVDIFSYFEVLNSPVTDPKIKVSIDPEIPAGLIYRIQIAVFRNPVLPSYFKGIIPAFGFKVPGTDKIIYYVGMFRKSADAAKAQAITRSKGFKDAFVVPLVDNKKVSSDRAVQLEKEWGSKPFTSIESVPDAKADTTTQTLVFKVEVKRTSSPMTEDQVEEIRKLASKRGLEVIQRLDGKISYLVGKFITFETAQEYADLLKRNGYQESQVVSWLGRKEIPIESAKKLFENLK